MEKVKAVILISALLAVMVSGCSDTGENEQSSDTPSVSASTVESSDISENTESSDTSNESVTHSQYCAGLADKILGFAEFSAMEEVTDAAMLSSIIDVKTSDIEEYCIYHNLISVNLEEVIVIRSNNTDATLKALENRKTTLIEQLAFYPEQKASAEATVVGSKGDICYLITHSDAKNIEKQFLNIL
ncbi:MAG: DUF4358 domain-containing protein [Eubacterium sp.]|nr:DUF4358 domain-containing protein [Eubacterium sp.]